MYNEIIIILINLTIWISSPTRMENKSFAHLLYYDGSGIPALEKKPVFMQPGKALTSIDSSIKVYLGSGFPELTPQSDFSLSPTLQLNGDLASFTEEELQQIGQAELKRINSTTYRSYTRNPDFRVAVLGSSAQSLTQFLETYGGVLEIEPLLLKGYHSEYQTIDDLKVTSIATGYTLEYTVRTPVDKTLCSYCGLCGPVCPEDCLDPDLFLDISRCSYCNECVKICPVNAIDLYRAEKRTLDIPALVLLDNATVDLPDGQEHVFTPETLDTFFSSLVPFQIDETVILTSSLCQFSTRSNTGCQICLDSCPHQAITKNDEGLAVNHISCTECGSCLSSCPTGALQFKRFNDSQFIEWFSSVSVPKNCTIVLGNEQHLHALWWKKEYAISGNTLFLEYPNVRALTSMHFLFLLSLGASRVLLVDSASTGKNTPVGKQIQLANSIIAELYDVSEKITVTSPTSIKKLSPDVEPIPLKSCFSNFSYTNRRDKLASVLLFLQEQKTEQSKESIILNGPVFDTFGSLTCDAEKCTHCGACLNDCKIESLTSDEETLSLNHLGIQCIQCGACVAVCPEDALELNQGLSLDPDFFKPRELTRAEAMRCRECGKTFGTKKSFDHVMAKLKSHEVTDGVNFFEYCDKCRVVKLFESHQS